MILENPSNIKGIRHLRRKSRAELTGCLAGYDAGCLESFVSIASYIRHMTGSIFYDPFPSGCQGSLIQSVGIIEE
jgi:hypothetical protein